jgi:hypothetical protein
MPRTAQAIIDHADALAARFEQHQPGVHVRDASALGTVRGATLGTSSAQERRGRRDNRRLLR